MIWKDLVRTAFLGTERTALPAAVRTVLADRGMDIDNPPEELLLEALVIYSQFEKAKRMVQPFDGELNQAPEETTQRCSARSAKHLDHILNGAYGPALDEFVHYLTLTQKRMPPEALPDILTKAAKDDTLWQKIQPALGERGRWLLNQHPAWKTRTAAYTPEFWEVASRSERVQMLRPLRKDDSDKALSLLQSTWSTEDATTKKYFLEVIGEDLQPTDESFLMPLLEDRHKDARQLSAGFLARLPKSDYRKALEEVASTCISINSKMLELILPNLETGQWQALHLEIPRNTPKDKTAEAAMAALMRLVPPSVWEELLEKEAFACLQAFVNDHSGNRWTAALLEATLLHQDKNWATAFVQYWLQSNRQKEWQTTDGKKILRLLPNASFNALAIRYLSNHFYTLEEDHLITHLLCLGAHRWDDNLTMMVVRNMQDRLSNANAFFADTAMHYFRILKVVAYHCNPNLQDTLKTGWHFKSRMWNRWEREVENFLRILTFRKEMIKALKS